MEAHDIIVGELNLFEEVLEAYDLRLKYSSRKGDINEALAIYKRVSERLGHDQS